MTGLFYMQGSGTVLIQGNCQCLMNESVDQKAKEVVVNTA